MNRSSLLPSPSCQDARSPRSCPALMAKRSWSGGDADLPSLPAPDPSFAATSGHRQNQRVKDAEPTLLKRGCQRSVPPTKTCRSSELSLQAALVLGKASLDGLMPLRRLPWETATDDFAHPIADQRDLLREERRFRQRAQDLLVGQLTVYSYTKSVKRRLAHTPGLREHDVLSRNLFYADRPRIWRAAYRIKAVDSRGVSKSLYARASTLLQ